MNYGYVRVSTKEQNTDRQNDAIDSLDIAVDMIFTDYQSGKDFSRPAYQQLISVLSKGDLLIIKSIDRLGRNYDEILIQWQHITKEIEADILVITCRYLTREKRGTIRQESLSRI